MRIRDELAQHSPAVDSAVTIGVFDGVHRGHLHLLSNLRREAGRTARASVVITFRNHPASVIRPAISPRFLTTVEERLRLIEDTGIDIVAPVTFGLELSRIRAREFAALLQERLRMKQLVVGPDFAMGHRREGDVSMLASLGEEMGFSVVVVEPLIGGDGEVIKSTLARVALSRGDIARVSNLLGRKFGLSGTVVKGHGRGGPMGFPTANLEAAEGMAVPGNGIYATWAHVGEGRYMAATSIGVRPTFKDGDHTIEAYLMDFDADLYGREIRLEFIDRLRDELSFDSVEELQEQIEKDVYRTRAVLEASG
jgi:riboflavin kinase/FMN adenylyltransferase